MPLYIYIYVNRGSVDEMELGAAPGTLVELYDVRPTN